MKNLTKISKLNEKLILDEGDSFKEWYYEPSANEYAKTLDKMDNEANENVPKGYRVSAVTSSDNIICYIYTPYGDYRIKNGYKNVDDFTITKDKTKLCIIDYNKDIKLSTVYNYSGDEYYGRVFQNLIPVFEYYKGNLPKEIDYIRFEDEDTIDESLKEGKYGFVKEYKGYRIMNTPDYYVITDKNGKTITQTKWGLPVAEAIIDDIIEQNSNNISNESLKEDDEYGYDDLTDKDKRDMVIGMLRDGALDDPEYVKTLNDKQFNDLVDHYVVDYFKKEESLKEDVEEEDELLELEEPIDEEPIEDNIEEPTEPVTQEVADNAYLMQINDLIASEYAKIDNVKSIIATFDSEDAIQNNSEVISILNAFIDETTISIGMLTKASGLIDSDASSLMQQGIDKAEEVINDVDEEEKSIESEEPVKEDLNLTGKLKKYNIADKEELRKKIDKVMTNLGYLINQNKFSKMYKEDWKFIKDVLYEYLTNTEE